MQGLRSIAFAAKAATAAAVSTAPTASTAVRARVRPHDVAPTRGLITASALKFLERLPIGEAGRHAFRFRGPAGHGSNARELMRGSIDALARQGLVRDEAATGASGASGASVRGQRGTGSAGPLLAIPVMQTEDVIRHCAEHGPVRLVLPQAARTKDGTVRDRDEVVLATFEDPKRRTIAVLLDGDTQQCNAVMDKLKDWMAVREDVRELHELTREDFDAFDASQRASGGTERVHQMAFRFVDLDEVLSTPRGTRAAPLPSYRAVGEGMTPLERSALLLCDRRVQTLYPLLSEDHEFCLQILLKQDPRLVEPFRRPS